MGALDGQTVLVTRPRELSLSLVGEIERHGGKAVVVPVIRIEPPKSWVECDTAVARLRDFSAIVFTSVSGVQGFLDRCRTLGTDFAVFSSMRIYAVGERTREALEQSGVSVTTSPLKYTAADLAQSIVSEEVAGKRVLLPQGNLARKELSDRLKEKGALVETVAVYRNLDLAAESATALVLELERFKFDGITFASPSAVRALVRLLGGAPLPRRNGRPWVAVIGPTTEEATRSLGIPVDCVAGESTAEGMMDAVVRFLGRGRSKELGG
jgi:uroporphyrinogen-III synthase